jgi:hypothetical protein
MRECKHCGVTEDIIKFYERKYQGRIQKLNVCMCCQKENRSLFYEKNRKNAIAYVYKWRKENRERHNLNERKRRNKYRIEYNEYQRLQRIRKSL